MDLDKIHRLFPSKRYGDKHWGGFWGTAKANGFSLEDVRAFLDPGYIIDDKVTTTKEEEDGYVDDSMDLSKQPPKALFLVASLCTRTLKQLLTLENAGVDVTLGYVNETRILKFAKNKLKFTATEKGMEEIINDVKPSIVHVHHAEKLALLARKVYPGFLITDFHDTPRKYQNEAIQVSDLITTVHPDMARWIERTYKTTHVESVTSILDDPVEREEKLSAKDGETHLCLIGSLYREHIAREECKRLAKLARRLKVHIHLFLNNFREVAKEYETGLLHLEREIPFDNVGRILSRYDAGIVHSYCLDSETAGFSFPNKLFDYISAGIPSIVDITRKTAVKFVKKHRIGIGCDIGRLSKKGLNKVLSIKKVHMNRLNLKTPVDLEPYQDLIERTTMKTRKGLNLLPKKLTIGVLDRYPRIRDVKQAVALDGSVNIVFMSTNWQSTIDVANRELIGGIKHIYVENIEEVITHCKGYDIDIIHTHNSMNDEMGEWGLAVRDKLGIPVVHECHDTSTCYGSCTKKIKECEERVMRNVDAVICVSEAMREHLHDRYGIGDKCIVLHSYPNRGLLPKMYAHRGEDAGVYQGGFMSSGHRLYAKIFKKLTEQNVSLDIYPAQGRGVIANSMAGEKINVHEYIDDIRDLYDALSRYDFGFVGYNRAKGTVRLLDMALPNKLYEYIGCGIPILAMDYDSIANFVRKRGIGVVVNDDIALPDTFSEDMVKAKDKVEFLRDELVIENEIHRLTRTYLNLYLKKVVSSVTLPETDNYYEKTSTDGYSFLGIARSRVGLDISECIKALKGKSRGLNKPYKIMDVIVPANTNYVYTSHSWVKFMDLIGKYGLVDSAIRTIDKIGQYKDGYVRYCEAETHYTCPNVTPLAAELYSMVGRHSKARELVKVTRKHQKDGNWCYKFHGRIIHDRIEDSSHVGYIIYGLRRVERLSRVETGDVIEKALKVLREYNPNGCETCRIGWNPPWVLVATYGIDDFLAKTAIKKILLETIFHSNFRVRAMGVWALTEVLS